MRIKPDVEAYSESTGKSYPNWDALIEAETNGYLAIAIISNGKQTWPYVNGPFTTQAQARKVAARLRAKWRRQQKAGRYPNQTYSFHVRPAWKDEA